MTETAVRSAWRAIAVAACVSGPASGCRGLLTAPPAEPVLEVGPSVTASQPSYSWTRDSVFTWVVANPRAVDAFYYPGNLVYLERYVGKRWEAIGFYGGAEAQPVRLPAGHVKMDNVPLTNDTFPVAGWYRVHTNIYRDSLLTQRWPLGNSVSSAVWVGQ